MNLLYIDPGTGSALFSILFGVIATLYFLGRALIIKLKVAFSAGIVLSPSVENQYVIYNEGIQYSNLFKPIVDEFEKRQINILYLTSSKDDPLLKMLFSNVKAEYIGEGNMAFARLNMLKANVVLMTTPGLDVYQLKRSKGVNHYAHVLHAPSDATMYRLFGLDYFDSVILTGEYQAADIRILESKRGTNTKKLFVAGCSYLDFFTEKLKEVPIEKNHKFTVLVSPSWGPSAILSRFGAKLLDPLIKSGLQIIVRPHPQSIKSEADKLEELKMKYIHSLNLEWDFKSENIYSLVRSDIMISDYSGIIYDYAFLFNKPVMYVKQGFDLRPYDADDLGEDAIEKLWQFKTLKKIGIELKEEEFQIIGEIIQQASDSVELRHARQKARDTAWQYRGEAGKRVVDFMLSVNENLELKH